MTTLDEEKPSSWKMFDAISRSYDKTNRLLSFGVDRSWRKKMKRFLPKGDIDLLDVATGTADQILAFETPRSHLRSVIGVDLSPKMLEKGREKVRRLARFDHIQLLHGSALDLPLEKESRDCVTISFGIRNIHPFQAALKEAFRVLRPGGTALILEFSLPSNAMLRAGHLFYLKHILPKVGKWVSSHPRAYTYLGETIQSFPYGQDFVNALQSVGFCSCQIHPLTGGIVSLYQALKPSEP